MYLVESFVPYECMLFIYLNNWPLLFSLIPDSLKVFYNFLDISDWDNLGWICLISYTFSSRKHTCIVSCRVSTNELYMYIYLYTFLIHTYVYIYIHPCFAHFYRVLPNPPKMISLIWRIMTPLTPLSGLLPTLRKSSDTSPDEFSCPRDPQIMGKPYGKLPIPFPYLWGFLWE